ncbi:hypothetical protein [Dongia sp.]|uniref:hypothetical protein n=1 Tax=Dongia sp. TaxID=1977262 RepID=UPI0035B19667
MSSMAQSGFTVGMVSGGLVGLGLVASKAVDNAVAHQQALSTVHRWSIALDRMTQRATKAERRAARQALEIQSLRDQLALAQVELEILREC